MLKAIDILKEIGFDHIVEHEQHLMRKTIAGLQEIGRSRCMATPSTSPTRSASSCSISLEDLTAKLQRRSRKGVLSRFAKALFARAPMRGDC
jgi:selenocysteine lyase/cysteine desulfurase